MRSGLLLQPLVLGTCPLSIHFMQTMHLGALEYLRKGNRERQGIAASHKSIEGDQGGTLPP